MISRSCVCSTASKLITFVTWFLHMLVPLRSHARNDPKITPEEMVKERFSVPVSTMREAVVSDTAQLAVFEKIYCMCPRIYTALGN